MPHHHLHRAFRLATTALMAASPLWAGASGGDDNDKRWSVRLVPATGPVRPFDTLAQAQRERWALELKPAPSAAQQFRAGLLRVELSSTSAVTLRPRGGGLSVAWQARF